ncbi:MAG TPA: ATP-binding protein [Chryseosolibacter sp.]
MVDHITQIRYEQLVGVVQKLSVARDLATVVAIVKSAARELSGADGASFILREGNLCSYVDEDAISPLWKGKRFPMEECVSGWSMINKASTVIPDIYKDPRIPADAYRPTFVKSMVMVPIRQSDPIGAVGTYWAQHYVATPDEVSILQSLADITAVTIENITLYKNLEQRVLQRTADLQSFTYALTHDIQSPLRMMNFAVEVFQTEYKDALDENGRQLLGRMAAKGKEMHHLIDGLMNLFNMTKQEMKETLVPMKELVQEVVHDILQQEVHRRIAVKIDDLPSVHADPVLLRQVWANLLGNAVKYTKSTPHASINVSAETFDGRYIYSVEDNGTGFDMRYYDKLFIPFQRLHSRSEYEGAGLGLSMVEKIIQRHDGKIWAQSSLGKGSTFYFSLKALH